MKSSIVTVTEQSNEVNSSLDHDKKNNSAERVDDTSKQADMHEEVKKGDEQPKSHDKSDLENNKGAVEDSNEEPEENSSEDV